MEKKIAIISDIHGNHSALEAALNKINEDQTIEHIYCLGDLIGIGYQTNEVLELLITCKNISYVMGNHDEAIIDILSGREPYSKGKEKDHHKWIAERLDPKFIPFLINLPIQLRASFNGKSFLFVHYHLNDQNHFCHLDLEPSEKKLDEFYHTSSADVVCFGHHHVVHHFKTPKRLYINPSSLGCNFQPTAPLMIVTIGENGEISPNFLEVPYDNKNFLQGYRTLNVPDSDYILKIFHGNQHLKF